MTENELFVQNQKLIYHCIRNHFPEQLKNEDLFQECSIGLLKAIRGFDETKSSFSTFAYTCILNEAKMFFKRNNKYWINESNSSSLMDDGDYLDFVPSKIDLIAEVDTETLKQNLVKLCKSDRDKYIITRLLEGAKQSDVSKEINICRQTVCLVWKRFREDARKVLKSEGLF